MTGKIKGTGSYIPVQVWDNDKLSHMMDTSDEWIRGRTGIGQRHIASGEETVSYMAAKAGEAALADAKMKPEEIDLILVSTMSAEKIMPCAACEVQKLLGAVHATCFDLNGACTGYGTGLSGRTDLPHSSGDRSGGAFPSHQLAGQKHLRAVWRWSRGCGAGSRSVGGVRSGHSFHWK